MFPIRARVRAVVRHGICSNEANMQTLQLAVAKGLGRPLSDVDNQSYNWQASILSNGVELAKALLDAPAADGVALVGHSMGGLVCRVANCALTDPNFLNVVNAHKAELPDTVIKQILATPLRPHRVGATGGTWPWPEPPGWASRWRSTPC